MSLTNSCLVKSIKQWKNVFRQIGLRHALNPSECHGKNCLNPSNQPQGFVVVVFGRRHFSTSRKPFLFPTRLIFRQNVRFYPKRKPLPFERKIKITKQKEDILLYQSNSKRFFKMVHVCGISQFFMWVYIAVTLYQIPMVYEGDEKSKERTGYVAAFGRAAQQVMTEKHKYSRTIILVVAGAMLLVMSLAYPARNVRQLWLSDSGKFVKVSTFALFEGQHPLTVPITGISCVEGRNHSTSHLPLRIQGQKFFYLIDKNSGKFYDEETFDSTVGMSRPFKF